MGNNHYPPLHNVFYKFLPKENRIFKNNYIKEDDLNQYKIINRKKECYIIADIIRKGLLGKDPSNLVCYGSSGTGKTYIIRNILNLFPISCKKIGLEIPITALINCKIISTGYRIFTTLCNLIGTQISSGFSLDQVYYRFLNEFEKKNQYMVIAFDEFHELFEKRKKMANNLLYLLVRLNSQLQKAKICNIFISNSLNFIKHADDQVLTSLNAEKCEFTAYTIKELQKIIYKEVKFRFFEGVVSQGIINLTAALSVKRGDARYAINLINKAGELAERDSEKTIKEEHVKKAKECLEIDIKAIRIRDLVLHELLVLKGICILRENVKQCYLISGNVYKSYKSICINMGITPLSPRRISTLIVKLNRLNLISTTIINNIGCIKGRTKQISLRFPNHLMGLIEKLIDQKL